ncbi:MAG: hypothetical protein ACREAA_15560 [Candidatus Polarisedimenticolia bacterium]
MTANSLVLALSLVAAPASQPDVEEMIEHARRVQEADILAWSRHRFLRRVTREKLNPSGEILGREVLEFSVTPAESGFDEILLRIDGRLPTSREVEEHRRAARFSKHYARLRAREGDQESSRYSLAHFLRMSAYRYVGREIIEGVACHRIEFGPGTARSEDGLTSKFARSMSGTIWLSEHGLHIVRAEARSVRRISIIWGLGRVSALEVHMNAAAVPGDDYLPRRIVMRAGGHALGVRFIRRYTYEYSDFVDIGGATTRRGS